MLLVTPALFHDTLVVGRMEYLLYHFALVFGYTVVVVVVVGCKSPVLCRLALVAGRMIRSMGCLAFALCHAVAAVDCISPS